ncbi:MAG: hypothetical protein IT305_27725 [Chloroflexi bacterium]|nr:hypothetical protein [Chloroflexota bacterium]
MSLAEPRSVTTPPGALAPAAAVSTDVTPPRDLDAGRLALSRRLALSLLVALALAAMLIQGGVFVHKTWLWTGDNIYHRAVMAEIRAGEILPGGPYAGLPAFYSPLFHYLVVTIAAPFDLDLTEGIRILSILWAPLAPLAAYWLARTLGFDRTSALLGAVFSTFAGALKTTEDRVWVDALFVGQHNFFPVFPRDIAFLLLPLGIGCVYRGVVQGWRPGGLLAGLAFGLMILAHTQTAVFAAPLLAIYLGLLLALRRDLLGPAIRVSLVTSAVALGISSFWWIWQIASIAQSGSFGVHMPADRVPVKLQVEEFPEEFGVFLLLGPLGMAMVARRFWRQRDPATLLLLVWFFVPVMLAVFRPTGFPGGDTFFPRRLWQFGSQPLLLVAGLALVAAILRPLRLRAPVAIAAATAVVLVACVPGSLGTAQRVGEFWNTPSFGDQEWDPAGNFGFGAFLADEARAHGLQTVLVPTPEATLVWYYAGQKVVYLYPTAAIKLAYDVERMTGHSEADRATDLVAAYLGDPNEIARVAQAYSARYVVLKRLGDRLAGVDVPAAGLVPESAQPASGRIVATNHYQYAAVSAKDRLTFQVWSPSDRTATVVLRAKRRERAQATLGTLGVNGTSTTIADSELPRDTWADVRRDVALHAGWNGVMLDSDARLEVIRFAAYTLTLADLPPEWRVAYDDGWYVVLAAR